jgi:hypothetical protein
MKGIQGVEAREVPRLSEEDWMRDELRLSFLIQVFVLFNVLCRTVRSRVVVVLLELPVVFWFRSVRCLKLEAELRDLQK